jgi:hypothetical protein
MCRSRCVQGRREVAVQQLLSDGLLLVEAEHLRYIYPWLTITA